MRIRETGCDSSIVLSKFKFNCDEIDKSIPDPLPKNLNHFLLIVGKPGSSKTTLLMNLICKRGKMYVQQEVRPDIPVQPQPVYGRRLPVRGPARGS